jgi:MEDS: MEthanogen/methylotroph, DcmR Sensory domain
MSRDHYEPIKLRLQL